MKRRMPASYTMKEGAAINCASSGMSAGHARETTQQQQTLSVMLRWLGHSEHWASCSNTALQKAGAMDFLTNRSRNEGTVGHERRSMIAMNVDVF